MRLTSAEALEAGYTLGKVFSLAETRIILRHAASLQRLAVEQCNRELSAGEEKRISTQRLRIAEICQKHGATPMMHGDPRGCVVKILHANLPNNSWGGDGYCIPTPRY